MPTLRGTRDSSRRVNVGGGINPQEGKMENPLPKFYCPANRRGFLLHQLNQPVLPGFRLSKCKLLWHIGLRRRGRAPRDVNPYSIKVYVNLLMLK